MSEGALFVAWGPPLAGRETAALDLFQEVKDFNETLRKKNDIASFDSVLLSHTGGPYRGFFLLRGDPMKLAGLIGREEFIRLATKASLVCENLTITPAYVGEMVPQMIDTYRTAINTLALQHQHV